MTETMDPSTVGVFPLSETGFFWQLEVCISAKFSPLIISAYAQHRWQRKLRVFFLHFLPLY